MRPREPVPAAPARVAFPALTWLGVTASVTHRVAPEGEVEDLCGACDTLYVSLEEIGGRTAVARTHRASVPSTRPPEHATLLAAGDRAWEISEPIRLHRRVRLAFDASENRSRAAPRRSRLMFADRSVVTCARLLAAQCEAGHRSGSLYGAAVAMALDDALAGGGQARIDAGGLAPWQLQRAKDYMQAHLAETITITQLAALTGLSDDYFGRAFKSSTGLPPHRWHLRLKVERAQDLLMDPRTTLQDVVAETGFSDQSHLTRTFRSIVGVPPGVWRRQRRG